MRIVGDVDCNTCAYLASHYCNSCYHNDDFEDNYEEASPEELKKRQRSEQQEMENALYPEAEPVYKEPERKRGTTAKKQDVDVSPEEIEEYL